jgi:phage terminase large subunit-like protein
MAKPIKLDISPQSVYMRYRKPIFDYYKYDYNDLWKTRFFEVKTLEEQVAWLRYMFLDDLFFMLYYGFNRADVNGFDDPFILQACRMLEDGPVTDTVDLWARGFYKSTTQTQAHTLQDILKVPSKTAAIFSHTRPIAKAFLIPIKGVLESNILLKFAFPDILWANPKRDAPVWSLDEGLELKRDSVSNTRSIEAWGLVDGMPTSKHFDIRVYDDVVTEKTATSPDMIQKAEDAFRLSDNLGTPDGWQRIVGTNYSHGDFYSTIEAEAKNGTYPWKIRKHPWFCEYYTEEDIARLGIPSDYIDVFGYRKPRLLTWQQALKKRKKQSSYIWATQMELNPSNRDNAEFKREWLKSYRELPSMLSKYLFVDPANEKKKTSDFTAMALLGIDCFGNRFLVDMLRDKLNLGERWKAIKKIVNDNDGIKCAYYEKYGKDSDIWYMQQRQLEEGCYFPLEAIGGVASKNDRIRNFIPTCENGKFFIPEKPIIYHGRDLVREFVDQEYSMWPFCKKKDMIDCISRVEDPEVEIVKPLPNMTQGHSQAESLMNDYYEAVSCDEQI